MGTSNHGSYRLAREKLKLKICVLIVLARFLSLLMLILSYYRERC